MLPIFYFQSYLNEPKIPTDQQSKANESQCMRLSLLSITAYGSYKLVCPLNCCIYLYIIHSTCYATLLNRSPINITSITLYIEHTILKITILWVGSDWHRLESDALKRSFCFLLFGSKAICFYCFLILLLLLLLLLLCSFVWTGNWKNVLKANQFVYTLYAVFLQLEILQKITETFKEYR